MNESDVRSIQASSEKKNNESTDSACHVSSNVS